MPNPNPAYLGEIIQKGKKVHKIQEIAKPTLSRSLI